MFNQIVDQYPRFLDFYYRVVNSMQGTQATDLRLLEIEGVAQKIFLQAASVAYLRSGSNIFLSNYTNGAHVIDFPSTLVIARSILETFINLSEIFFESKNDDEFEYRYCVYRLNGFIVIEDAIKANPNPQYLDAAEFESRRRSLIELEQLRERIKRTKYYQKLDHNQKESSLKGYLCPHRDWSVRATTAGFGPFIERLYRYLSAYAHSDALSVAQVVGAPQNGTADTYVQISITIIMMVLAHVISHYEQRFSGPKVVCQEHPQDRELAKYLVREAMRSN